MDDNGIAEEDVGYSVQSNKIISINCNYVVDGLHNREWKITVGGDSLEECYHYIVKCKYLMDIDEIGIEKFMGNDDDDDIETA